MSNTTQEVSRSSQILAPFYTGAEYTPPPAGSYKLPPLGKAADGTVLSDTGEPTRLFDVFGDRMVLMSFIYSTCTDINGCPLATAVMYAIQQKLQEHQRLQGRLRMVSLSFDPQYDTPEVMRLYGAGFQGQNDWRFLTTASWADLQPILQAYGQSVIRDNDEQGEALPSFSHTLRVFLIDMDKRIRNIYSVSFLYPELIINDAETLLMERAEPLRVASAGPLDSMPKLSVPGDYKGGYESADYVTRSLALTRRVGHAADLLGAVQTPPLGLPALPVPAENPLTREKIALGRKLFFDRRLSLNDTFSCAMCHIPEQGFTNNEVATAVGVEGRTHRRNSPSLYNVAFSTRLFHDGREYSLENQVWGPLLAHNEMANPSVGAVLKKISGLPEYAGRFEQAFDGRGPTMETVGMALASYQRTLVSGNSPFDRWYYGQEENAVNDAAKRGFALFTGKAGCSSCHLVGSETALFTDNAMYNTGLGFQKSMGVKSPTKRVMLAPGVFVDVPRDIIDSVAAPPPADVGLYEVTQNPHDRWKYKTPGLRNVALTPPYMHDGSLGSLEEVVRFYNQGGVPNELLDPRIRRLDLSEQEIADLVSFMQSLTGDNVDMLVSDAFAAPVGDITRDDPHWAHDNPNGE